MGGVIHDFECLAHGWFEQRVSGGKIPKCPQGCSASLVKMVHLQPVGFVSARTRKADKLVREMAATQRLSDISTSPSRPGNSVMDRLRKKHNVHPSQLPFVGGPEHLGAMTHRTNALQNNDMANFTGGPVVGRPYESAEWTKDEKTGKVVHTGAQQVESGYRPPASVERVKEKLD